MKVRGSAEGAEYDSQGQARSASPLVTMNKLKRALKVRNININYSALSELHGHCGVLPGATRLTLFGACPWAVICRAFGAQFQLLTQSYASISPSSAMSF